MSKSFVFLVKSFLGNFYRHLAIFSGYTGDEGHFFCKNIASDLAVVVVVKWQRDRPLTQRSTFESCRTVDRVYAI